MCASNSFCSIYRSKHGTTTPSSTTANDSNVELLPAVNNQERLHDEVATTTDVAVVGYSYRQLLQQEDKNELNNNSKDDEALEMEPVVVPQSTAVNIATLSSDETGLLRKTTKALKTTLSVTMSILKYV